MRHVNTAAATALALALLGTQAQALVNCYGSYGGTKTNQIYLYFPTTADASYPEFSVPGTPPTSPAAAFDISLIPNYTGTTADLENAVTDVVTDDYCEFDVQVIATTTAPPTTFPNRNIVSIGTDDGTAYGGLFGLAQNVDFGDQIKVDYAHEWAATYQGLFGGAGGALNGVNSTLEHWGNSIGGTASHEAGHNYGLSHSDGLVLKPGEDPLVHHLMAPGSNYSGFDRADYRRHFSDTEYSILAANIGLAVQTVWNWDFVNPNAQTASKLVMDILSTQNPLTVSSTYNGGESPWSSASASASLGTQVFNGVTYNHFQVTWSAAQAWDGHVTNGPGPATGVPGQVAGGASFHVGTQFTGVNYSAPTPIIIINVSLLDAGNNVLNLHPRNLSFDSGTFDSFTQQYAVGVFNVAGAPLQINNVQVLQLPRLASIAAMIDDGKKLVDVRNVPFTAWNKPRTFKLNKTIEDGGSMTLPVAKRSDGHHVVGHIGKKCDEADRLQGPDAGTCYAGNTPDLFPATATYLIISQTDPAAHYWDYAKQKYVNKPLTTRAYMQAEGIKLPKKRK